MRDGVEAPIVGYMTTQDSERSDPVEPAAENNTQQGKSRQTDRSDAEQESMTDAFAENVQELGRGENPMTQGDDLSGDEDRSDDGNADAFSPARGDQPE